MFGKRRLDDESNPAEYVWHSYKETFESVNKCASGIYQVVGALNGDEEKKADFDRFLERGKRDDEKETTEEAEKFEAVEAGEENDIGRQDDSEKIDYFEDKYENIGIYSVNRPEWMITALGASSITMKPIALYDTLGKDSVSYIINHANIRVVVCSKDKIRTVIICQSVCYLTLQQQRTLLKNKILDAKKEKDLGLKVIIQMDFNPKYNNKNEYVCEELIKEAEKAGIRLIGFCNLLKFVLV